MNATKRNADALHQRVRTMPIPRAHREAAVAELERAERAAEWTVRTMDRLESVIEGMRRAARLQQRRAQHR